MVYPGKDQALDLRRVRPPRRGLPRIQPADTVFQRLIGRAPKEATDFANWGMGWWRIRDMIDEELEKRGTCQGARCDYLHGKAVRKFMK